MINNGNVKSLLSELGIERYSWYMNFNIIEQLIYWYQFSEDVN